MRAADLFPGIALIPLTPVAMAVGFAPKTARNKFYAGQNPLGIIQVGSRLLVPAENLDAFLANAYREAGHTHLLLAAQNTPAPAPVTPTAGKRGRGRPRKNRVGGKAVLKS